MSSPFLSIGQVASLIGVCSKTLRRWDIKGSFKSDIRTRGNHRRYKKSKVLEFIKKEEGNAPLENTLKCAVYGRVSSSFNL